MRTILPTLLVVALAAAFLVSHLNKTAPQGAEPESIAGQLHAIVSQSLKVVDTQSTTQTWQDLRAEGSAVDIMTFLSENPTSPHKEEAVAHLQTLLGDETVTRTAPDLLTLGPATGGFEGVLSQASLETLIESAPHFPPMDGLPADLWQNKSCKTCHQWTISGLCEQANTYQQAGFDPATEAPHPFGVDFKVALRNWSLAGCS